MTKVIFQGCKKCSGCINGPIRGNYDGLVVLTVITKDVLPASLVLEPESGRGLQKKEIKQPSDHEIYALNLEQALVSHFKYSETDYSARCAWNRRAFFETEQSSNEKTKNGESPTFQTSGFAKRGSEPRISNKKVHGYVIYVTYRLETDDTEIVSVGQHNPVLESKDSAMELFNEIGELNGDENGMDDHSSGSDEDLEQVDEIAVDFVEKQLKFRLDSLEEEYKELQEKIKKLDHGRMWIENRLTVLEYPNECKSNGKISSIENFEQGTSNKRKLDDFDNPMNADLNKAEQDVKSPNMVTERSPI